MAPEAAAKDRTGGMRGPLLGSAAGHLLTLAACLLFVRTAGTGTSAPAVVEVFLDARGPASRPAAAPFRPGRVAAHGQARGSNIREEDSAPPVPAPSAPSAAVPSPDAGPVTPAPGGVSRELLGTMTETPFPGGGEEYGAQGGGEVSSGSPDGLFARSGTVLPARGGDPAGLAGPGGGGGEYPGTGLLRERIQSRIVYPPEAIRRGQEGEVVLRIRVGNGGQPKEVRVARSSGTRLLDDAARSGVVRAAPLPSAPGWVEVPVLFVLR